MKLNGLAAVICALVFTAPLAAQTSGTAADPISGGWGANGQTLLNLKYDGKGGVTGTVMAGRPGNLADIKTGTFDPAAGILKLRGDAKHPDTGATMPYSIDGTLANGALSVTYAIGESTGALTLAKIAGGGSGGGGGAEAAMQRGFAEVSGWISKSADLVPAEKYSYRPTPAVMTFAELVGHVADSYNYYCGNAAGQKAQWSETNQNGPADKARLAAALKQATELCTTAYTRGGEPGFLMTNIGHANLHYGNMITYIRMLGMVPPSSATK